MNPKKSIKKARHAIRQADSALKAAANALRNQTPGEEGAHEKPGFLAKAFNIPADAHSRDGLAAAAAMLRQQGPRAFKHGDEIEVEHRLGRLRFVVIGIDRDEANDRKHTLTLLLTSIVLGSAFDAPSLDNPWGRNSWHLSTIRAMLNGDFLDGFTEADRQVMAHTQRRTYSHTEREYIYTSEAVFLLSASEAGFEVDGENVVDEGNAYPYFKPGHESRQLSDNQGKGRFWYLRSSNLKLTRGDVVCVVTPSGARSTSSASSGQAIAAVCVIG